MVLTNIFYLLKALLKLCPGLNSIGARNTKTLQSPEKYQYHNRRYRPCIYLASNSFQALYRCAPLVAAVSIPGCFHGHRRLADVRESLPAVVRLTATPEIISILLVCFVHLLFFTQRNNPLRAPPPPLRPPRVKKKSYTNQFRLIAKSSNSARASVCVVEGRVPACCARIRMLRVSSIVSSDSWCQYRTQLLRFFLVCF